MQAVYVNSCCFTLVLAAYAAQLRRTYIHRAWMRGGCSAHVLLHDGCRKSLLSWYHVASCQDGLRSACTVESLSLLCRKCPWGLLARMWASAPHCCLEKTQLLADTSVNY
jgi:hypothetical protein